MGKRKKGQDSFFPVLKNNNEYLTWKKEFIAECNVQKLSNMINKNHRMDAMTDPFKKKLYDKQCVVYMEKMYLKLILNKTQQLALLRC